MTPANLYRGIPSPVPEELFETLVTNPHVRVERIVSCGQATASNTWYDQARPEWVALLQGQAGLRMENEPTQTLNPGDYLLIPAISCRPPTTRPS
jgi:cupin 2 domain-containing protein